VTFVNLNSNRIGSSLQSNSELVSAGYPQEQADFITSPNASFFPNSSQWGYWPFPQDVWYSQYAEAARAGFFSPRSKSNDSGADQNSTVHLRNPSPISRATALSQSFFDVSSTPDVFPKPFTFPQRIETAGGASAIDVKTRDKHRRAEGARGFMNRLFRL